MPPNPAQKVPPVAHRVPPGPHSRDVNSCPREREGGYTPIPPDLPGGYRPPGRLLLQLQRLSSAAGFRLTPKGRLCMYVWSSLIIWQSIDRLPVLLVVQRNSFFPPIPPFALALRSAPEKLVSRDRFCRPPVPRVRHLILHTRAEVHVYSETRFRNGVHLYRQTTSGQKKFIRSRICVPMAFTTNRLTAHGQYCTSPQGSSRNGCCLLKHPHGPLFVRLSFTTPTTVFALVSQQR